MSLSCPCAVRQFQSTANSRLNRYRLHGLFPPSKLWICASCSGPNGRPCNVVGKCIGPEVGKRRHQSPVQNEKNSSTPRNRELRPGGDGGQLHLRQFAGSVPPTQ